MLSLFYSGKVLRFSLASFSLRLSFFRAPKRYIFACSSPVRFSIFNRFLTALVCIFSRLPLGFVLDFGSTSFLYFFFVRSLFVHSSKSKSKEKSISISGTSISGISNSKSKSSREKSRSMFDSPATVKKSFFRASLVFTHR